MRRIMTKAFLKTTTKRTTGPEEPMGAGTVAATGAATEEVVAADKTAGAVEAGKAAGAVAAGRAGAAVAAEHVPTGAAVEPGIKMGVPGSGRANPMLLPGGLPPSALSKTLWIKRATS